MSDGLTGNGAPVKDGLGKCDVPGVPRFVGTLVCNDLMGSLWRLCCGLRTASRTRHSQGRRGGMKIVGMWLLVGLRG